MTLSSKQRIAIEWFVKEHKLKLRLSTPPIMYFTDSDGNEVKHDLSGIMLEYSHWNKEDQKQRAREKRVNATRSLIKSAF